MSHDCPHRIKIAATRQYRSGAADAAESARTECSRSGYACGDPDGDHPSGCHLMRQSHHNCPACIAETGAQRLLMTDGNRVWCPTCDATYPVAELLTYNEESLWATRQLFESEERKYLAAAVGLERLATQLRQLRAKLERHEAAHSAVGAMIRGVSTEARLS